MMEPGRQNASGTRQTSILRSQPRERACGGGPEVVVVGDLILNAWAAGEDHCEDALMVERGRAEGMQGEDGF
ncbi:hypothetical protein BD779DRAFT_1578519 [Infundibulicybe gibba]|nr:hypothetical protein BD779DRAFT_1578519 [Infundibulicybe gibba]